MDGTDQNLDIELPSTVGAQRAITARRDLAHGRLLIVAHPDGSSAGVLDYWLVQIQTALALGIDGVAHWVIRFVVTLLMVSLVVVLIVVQTVASVITGVRLGSERELPAVRTPVAAPVPIAGQSSSVDLGSRVIQLAQAWLGVPYLFGGCSRAGVDCSCLVQNVYRAAGIHLPRIAVDQFNAAVPISDPQPGDLVFFANTYEPGISHVGIYIGNGQQINAPTAGEVLSVAPVFTGYWGTHYAERVARPRAAEREVHRVVTFRAARSWWSAKQGGIISHGVASRFATTTTLGG